jgi:beta-glucosidase
MAAVVQAYLPGNYGGDAVADVLFGDVNPSGKLPYTYPSYPNSLVTYYHKPSEEQKRAEGAYIYESDYNPQYEFGFGLSYTDFTYSNLRISSEIITMDKPVEVSVDVKNTGTRTGKEVVMLYTSDLYASISPDVKRLRRFSKIELEPGQTKTVKFELKARDLAFVNPAGEWVSEPGSFSIQVGNKANPLKKELVLN